MQYKQTLTMKIITGHCQHLQNAVDYGHLIKLQNHKNYYKKKKKLTKNRQSNQHYNSHTKHSTR